MNSWVAPVVAGIVAGGIAFAAGTALSDDSGDGAASPATTAQRTGTTAGQAVFARMGCGGCHTLAAASSQGGSGPDLDERLPRYSRAALKAKIVDPYPGQVARDERYVGGMPEDFGRRLSDAELDALVSFLLAEREDAANAPPP